MDIKDELADIEREHGLPGAETIPTRDISWAAWRYGKASEWSTLYVDGGFANQPQWYLDDMEWFNTWDYYYSLEDEMRRLDYHIRKHPDD
jgi:hypothetical protein